MSTFKERFDEFDQKNPAVYATFKRLTLHRIAHGAKHYGAKVAIEVIRWDTDLITDGEPYKINNNFAAHYARRFMDEFPQYDGFYRTRELRC